MLEKSFGLFFFLKQPKNQKVNVRYVYLRITVDGISKEVSLKRTWSLGRWDQASGKATGTKEDAKTLNAYLDTLRNEVYRAKAVLLEKNKPITAENLKNAVTGENNQSILLLDQLRKHIEKITALIGTDFATATLKRYKTTLKHTLEFIKWKYGMEDIDIQDLNYEFVSEFSFWLKTVKECGHNSALKYIGQIKTIILQCIRKGWLKSDPFIEFKTNRKPVNITPLNQEDLDAMTRKAYETDRLNHVKDIFLFCCYTGLAYVDVKQLYYYNIVKGIDGEQWIVTQRQKTDAPTRVPLLPQAQDIVLKYQGDVKRKKNTLVLPVLSNQKMNAYLKEIADTCGITKKLTFHIARHTFATTVTLANGVPIETVSKMLGHSSLKQTQHYAKIVDLKVSHDMANLRQRLAK